jgi:hypothetical protein
MPAAPTRWLACFCGLSVGNFCLFSGLSVGVTRIILGRAVAITGQNDSRVLLRSGAIMEVLDNFPWIGLGLGHI